MAVEQSGPVAPFHIAAWFGNGVIADGGNLTKPFIDSVALFDGPNTPFSISSQTGPGVSTDPHARFSISQTDNTTIFNFEGINNGVTPSLFFNFGGALIPFPTPTPTGNSVVLVASEDITAPALVNITTDDHIRLASRSNGLPANGFIVLDAATGSAATVYFEGLLSGFSGLSGGPVFLSDTGGVSSSAPDSGSGDYAQLIGVAVAVGTIFFNPGLMNGPI